MNPHIYRTHDGGKTWKEIVAGIPGGAPVSVVREDPKRKGLLFAGSETQVYVSFDDGDHWQSLRLNMAASSVRDLVIKDDDLVVGTHGRGHLDPRRHHAAAADRRDDGAAGRRAVQAADRAARALEHEHRHAAAARRADRAESARRGDHRLLPEVRPRRVRSRWRSSAVAARWCARYSSDDEVFTPGSGDAHDPALLVSPADDAWQRRRACIDSRGTCTISRSTACNRVGGPTLPIAAVGHNTVPAPTTPWANPGTYTVRLTVNGKAYSQPIVVKQDPRVKTPALAMQQVYSLSKATYDGAVAAQEAVRQAGEIREQIAKVQPQASGPSGEALAAFDRKVEALVGRLPVEAAAAGRALAADAAARRGGVPTETLTSAVAALSGVMTSLQGADVQPTTMQLNAIARARALGTRVMTRWATLRTTELAALNGTLKSAGMAAIVALDPSSQPK